MMMTSSQWAACGLIGVAVGAAFVAWALSAIAREAER